MDGPTLSEAQHNGEVHPIDNGKLDSPIDASSPITKPLPSDDSGIVLDDSHGSLSPNNTHAEMNGSGDADMSFSDIKPLEKDSPLEESPKYASDDDVRDFMEVSRDVIVEEEEEEVQNGVTTGIEEEGKSVDEDSIVQEMAKKEEAEYMKSEIMAGATDITPSEDTKEEDVTQQEDIAEVISEEPEADKEDEEPAVQEEVISPQVKGQTEGVPEVTVTTAEETEAEAQEAQEEKKPEEPEVPRVDFKRGTRCTDVETALEILKTRYRLTTISTRKSILTWSCWNLKDLIHSPDDDDAEFDANAPIWSGQPIVDDLPPTEEVIDMLENIVSKEKALEELVDSVLEEERKKKKVPTATLR